MGTSPAFEAVEEEILKKTDALRWIGNRSRSGGESRTGRKKRSKLKIDFAGWERIVTPTGCRWISPTRDAVTRKVVVDGASPFDGSGCWGSRFGLAFIFGAWST